MTSLQRKLVRAASHRIGKKVENDRQQPTIIMGSGYYVLHATRGWRWIRYARAEAQQRMAHLLDNFVDSRKGRTPRSDHAGVNRHTNKPHLHSREIARRLRIPA